MPRHHTPAAVRLADFLARERQWITRLHRWLGGRIMRAVIRRTVDFTGFRPDRFTVLCLERRNFERDIEQLRMRTRCNWLGLRSRVLGPALWAFIPQEFRKQTDYFACRVPEAEAAFSAAGAFVAELLADMARRHRLDAVMSANTDYWQDESLKRACARLGLPFLVLSREYYNTEAKVEWKQQRYEESGFRFEGAGVAVFGPKMLATLTSGGVCPPDRIWITGPPRLDVWRTGPGAEPKDTLTLLSFARKIYLATGVFESMLDAFARFSLRPEARGIRCVVKGKNRADSDNVRRMLSEIPNRLIVTDGMDIAALFRRSRVIAGFNSLAVLEGLLTPAAVCCPAWGDAARDPAEMLIDPGAPDAARAVSFVRSPEEFTQLLVAAAEGRLPASDAGARLRLVREHFHYPEEGTCSGEVERFALEASARFRAGRAGAAPDSGPARDAG